MDMSLDAIEKIIFTNTQEKIIFLLAKEETDFVSLNYLKENIDTLVATLINELKKLSNKDLILIEEDNIILTKSGKKIINYYKFKLDVLKDFCNKNNIDINTFEKFALDKNYNNLNLLLGIKNLL